MKKLLKTFQLLVSLFIIILLLVTCKSQSIVKHSLKKSDVVHILVHSKSLNEDRQIDIYLPKGYQKGKEFPIVYCTDGQIVINSYKKGLDSLIELKLIPPTIVVGEYSNEKKTKNENYEYRNYEYVNNEEEVSKDEPELEGRFEKHYDFFTHELISYIEDNYSGRNKSRIFYGVSNGAGFGVTMSARTPKLFEKYICFSMAGGDYEKNSWNRVLKPYFYLSYGEDEPFPLVIGIQEFDKYLNKSGVEHILTTYKGGHNRKYWKKEFFRVLPKLINKN